MTVVGHGDLSRAGSRRHLADRATASVVVVGALQRWCEINRATVGRVLRTSAASTQQDEDSSLCSETIFARMFQTARVY